MKYWDASAIVPLLVQQTKSSSMGGLLIEDSHIVTWWATSIECCSAVMRLGRTGFLAPEEAERSLARLRELQNGWEEVTPNGELRDIAERLLRVHALRAADALQLSAALIACGRDTRRLSLVCADDRLRDAARKEGFEVLS